MKKRVSSFSVFRSVAVMFMVCILLFAAVACNRTEETKTQSDESTTEASKGSEDTASKETEEPTVAGYLNEESDYPIVNETITLNAMVTNHPMCGDITTYPCWDRLEELTNIHLEVEVVPYVSISEKVNLRMSSNVLPDVILGNTPFSDIELVKYADGGALIPLNDLIDNYAPNIKAALVAHPEIKQFITQVDGNIYSLPRDEGSNGQHLIPKDATVVNVSWLEKLGMEIPTTYDEFYKMLVAFKENDCNGNGDPDDEIPIGTAAASRPYSMALFSSLGFVAENRTQPRYIMVNDGVVQFGAAVEGYKQGLKYLQQWYAEGLLEPETFTIAPQNFNAKATQTPSVYGVILTNIPTAFLSLDQCLDEYAIIPPLKGTDGAQIMPINTVSAYRVAAVITKDCVYPEAAIRWFDYFFTNDGYAESIFGEPGINFEKNEDGYYTTIAPTDGTQLIQYMYQNNPRNWPGIEPESFEADILPDNVVLYDMLEPLKEYYSDEVSWPYLTMSGEDSEVLNMYWSDIDSYTQQMQAEFVMNADIDIDATWDSYIEELDSMELQKVMDIYQARYDELNK